MVQGLGIRAVARVFEVDPNTVLQWLVEVADHAVAFSQYFLHDVRVTQGQLDELFALLSAVKAGEVSDAEAIQRLSRSPHWVWAAIDPVTGGDSCVSTSAAAAPGTARYVLKRKGAPPFTLIGAPLLRADLVVSGAAPENAQLDARLWDVAPDGGSQRLVARGTYRPGGGDSWQLHPGAWRFGRDHAAVLELVGSDAPYARPSNGVFQVEVRNLQANLPAP